VRLALAAGSAILSRDLRLFVSYRLRFLSQTAAILFSVVLFYYLSRLVRVGTTFPTPDSYFGYAIVGLITLQLLTATVASTPQALRQELLAGTFERLVVAPLGPVLSILAMTLFPALLAIVVGAMMVGAAGLFGADIAWSTAPLAIPAALLCALAFLPLSLLVSGAVLVAKQAGSAATFLVTGLSLASGAFFPTGLLPGYVRWIAEVQPLTPALALLRRVLLGVQIGDAPGVAIAKLAGFGFVLLPTALFVLAVIVEVGRRQGTLTEY
jgi:ABC-type multidrug transport system permease subunit